MLRVVFSVLSLLFFATLAGATERLIVFVPASMTEVMETLAADYRQVQGQEIVLSIAGTSQLARQLDAGAPAHIFISADKKWLEWVEERDLTDSQTTIQFAGNRLVIAVRAEVENWVDVEFLVTKFPFAMGEPNSVPVGRYAREALLSKGWWEKAKTQAVYSENTRLTLRRLALGEVGAAIVYGTDAAEEPAVRTQFVFAEKNHSPIIYFATLTKTHVPDAAKFLRYLQSPTAGAIFAKAGFTPPTKEQ